MHLVLLGYMKQKNTGNPTPSAVSGGLPSILLLLRFMKTLYIFVLK